MGGIVEKIFVAVAGGVAMQTVEQVEAVARSGLRGDRYAQRTGYWSGVDECEVTLIEAEDLDEITVTTSLRVLNGEHRRNLVTRGIALEDLYGHRFQVGGAVLEYDRPRPPCTYIQKLTQQEGLTSALGRRGGICARVISPGRIRVQDAIVILGE
jgi:MOSC domain-containing protein YiiM